MRGTTHSNMSPYFTLYLPGWTGPIYYRKYQEITESRYTHCALSIREAAPIVITIHRLARYDHQSMIIPIR